MFAKLSREGEHRHLRKAVSALREKTLLSGEFTVHCAGVIPHLATATKARVE